MGLMEWSLIGGNVRAGIKLAGNIVYIFTVFFFSYPPAVGLIIAILIPVAVVVLLGVLASIFCYRKREW